MLVSILTLFPEMFAGPFDHSIIKNAQLNKLATIEFINIRDFGIGRHKVVDDKPYGGGTGMVLRVDVLDNAISHAKKQYNGPASAQRTVLMDARGTQFNQKKALEFSKLDHLILVAGHYEGFDQRIKDYLVDESISIGDYVLTGGELPAMVITDAILRLRPQVLKQTATQFESFSLQTENNSLLLEHPHYTKPQLYKTHEVPKVLLSGNHQEITNWRQEKAIEHTQNLRPDLLKK